MWVSQDIPHSCQVGVPVDSGMQELSPKMKLPNWKDLSRRWERRSSGSWKKKGAGKDRWMSPENISDESLGLRETGPGSITQLHARRIRQERDCLGSALKFLGFLVTCKSEP